MHGWAKLGSGTSSIELPHLPVLASTAYKVNDSVRWQWPSTVYGLSLCISFHSLTSGYHL